MSNDTPRDDATPDRPEDPQGPLEEQTPSPTEPEEAAGRSAEPEEVPGRSAESASNPAEATPTVPADTEPEATPGARPEADEAAAGIPASASSADDAQTSAGAGSHGGPEAQDTADSTTDEAPGSGSESEPSAASAADAPGSTTSAMATDQAAEPRPERKDSRALARRRKREKAELAAATAAAEKREARKKSPKPRARAKGSRLKAAVGIAGGAVLVAAVAAAAVAPKFIPTTDRHHLTIPSVRSGAGTTTYVCPPSPQRVGENASSDDAYSSGAQTAASSLSVLAQGDQAQRVPGTKVLAKDRTVKELAKDVKNADKGNVVRGADGYSGVKGVTDDKVGVADAAWMQVQPLGGVPSPAAGVRTVSQGSGDLTGFAAAPCATASNTVWLTGATTTLGHTAVLSVTNPSATPAGITATVYTKDGETTTGGIQPFTLKPGETRSFNLGGTAVEAEASSVKVESSGAAVSASINQTIMRGTTPGGIDTITGGSADTLQVMTGVETQGPGKSKSLGVSDDAGAETPQVQIADASGAGTQASVVATNDDGDRKVVKENAEIPADSVLGVDLSSLPKGTWTIQVAAAEPVVATTRMMKGDDDKAARDVAYVVASPALSTDQLLAVPTKGDARLNLTSAKGAGTVTAVPVKQNGTLGKSRKITVDEGRIATLDLKDLGNAAGVRLSGLSGSVYASLSSTDSDVGLGSTAIQQLPQAPASTRVDVGP